LTVYSTVSAHHTRLRDVASFVRRRLFSSGAALRGAACRTEMPGFFALAAEAPTLRTTYRHCQATQRSCAPCTHRLGERTERQCRGRVLSPRGAARQSPSLPRLAAEPGPRFPASGVSAHRYRDPTRLPRTQSTVGDQPPRLDRRPTMSRRRNRGLASAFRPLRAVAPMREENDDRPRPGPSPSCRWAIRSSWDAPQLLHNPIRQSTLHDALSYASPGFLGLELL
jgi:hypothetical protein